MSARAPLLFLTVLAALGTLLWFASGQAQIAPPTAPSTGERPAAAASAAEASGVRSDVAVEPATATRREDGSTASVEPLPEHAEWLDLIVVDEHDAPIAGADVYWHDQNAFGRLVKQLPHDQLHVFGVFWHQPELVYPRAGWHTQSDAAGRARVTLAENGALVALSEGRYARLELRPRLARPPEGLRLVLRPDRSITVRVVDDLDRPCDDVPVALAVVDADGDLAGPFGWAPMAATDTDGHAVIPHLQELVAAIEQVSWFGVEPPRVVLRSLLPGMAAWGPEVSLASPPEAPVVLRLPAMGTIRAAARGGDAGFRPRAFKLACAATPYEPERVVAIDEHGWARFRYVPVGQQFFVGDADAGNQTQEIAGPTLRDQEIEVYVTPPANAVILRGRLVDDAGTPLLSEGVQIHLQGPDVYEWAYGRTNDAGQFQVVVEDLEVPANVDRIDLHWEQAGPGMRARLPRRTLVLGVNDLGDVRPAPGETLVAGQLLVGGAPFAGPTTIWLERFAPNAEDPENAWQYAGDAQGVVERDGRFVVRGSSDPGRHRLCLSTEHALPHDPVEVRLGDTDVRIELQPAALVAASLLLPSGAPAEQLVVELVGPATTTGGEPERRRSYVRAIQGQRHGVDWTAMPPGRYTLEVRDWTSQRPTVSIPDVELPLPATGDARLVDIDLRSRLRVVELRVLGPDGAPFADGECVAFPAGQRADADWFGLPVPQIRDRTVGLLLLPAGPYDLCIAARGHRPAPLRGDAAKAVVRLGSWIELEVEVADVPQLPGRVTTEVRACAETLTGRAWRGPWHEESIDELLGGIGPTATLQNGVATVRASDGALRIEILVHGPYGVQTLDPVTPTRVLSTAGRVVVRAPTEAWQRAVTAVTTEPR